MPARTASMNAGFAKLIVRTWQLTNGPPSAWGEVFVDLLTA